ncbi:MAG: hypothetical protein EOM40_11300 [Clostridia bacterium]|nr:hypothetical protein [Clostridia bacterium]NCC44027.1 hypothetical protein [Clostridia bacterium]
MLDTNINCNKALLQRNGKDKLKVTLAINIVVVFVAVLVILFAPNPTNTKQHKTTDQCVELSDYIEDNWEETIDTLGLIADDPQGISRVYRTKDASMCMAGWFSEEENALKLGSLEINAPRNSVEGVEQYSFYGLHYGQKREEAEKIIRESLDVTDTYASGSYEISNRMELHIIYFQDTVWRIQVAIIE